ncbi:MAG: hydroxymethylglutaryl-CoA lyase [Fimbriimonadales bacterium]
MSVHLVEVGPRDGLQNEKMFIPTDVKVAFINALMESGLTEIEVSSFVSPKWVPQLADAEEVFSAINRKAGVVLMALAPNEKGLERALAAGATKIAVFTAASESFNQKNTNATIAESIERFRPIVAGTSLPIRGYVSTAFHCPFEGKISPQQTASVIQMLLDLGVSEISIGDTIGKAVPHEVSDLLDESLKICPAKQTALHFHDTFGNAIANCRTAYELGIRVFDSSAGGIGGCPFAPGAPGNVSTESLVTEFDQETGVDLDKLRAASALLAPFLLGSNDTD